MLKTSSEDQIHPFPYFPLHYPFSLPHSPCPPYFLFAAPRFL
jgi:hypothetical protein